jgi:hypothetical protein
MHLDKRAGPTSALNPVVAGASIRFTKPSPLHFEHLRANVWFLTDAVPHYSALTETESHVGEHRFGRLQPP